MRFAWISALALLVLAAHGAGAATPQYKIVARYPVGGAGGWDLLAVDSQAHRLYYGRSTCMQALDVETGKVVGELADTPGIHGVALAPGLRRGFTSNGRDSSVTIFDLKTLMPIQKVHLDAVNPDAILYDEGTQRVFCFNGGSNNATAIDAATGKVLGNIALGGKPELPQADGKGLVFVNLEDSSAVVAFDAKTLAVLSRWPLAPGEEPTGLAYDAKHGRLFSACANKTLIVLDAKTGRVVATEPIGEGPDGCAFDAERGLAFTSNGEGTLSIIREVSPERFELAGTVPTQKSARTLALDPKSHRIYLAAARYGDPAAPTAEHPRPRAPMVADSFEILVLAR